MKYKKILLETIKNIVESFNENELAYLAITSKVENPLRDKIAYNLHINKELSDKIICREWKDRSNPENKSRYDLVIINKENESVECIVEFKAHSLQREETSYIKSEFIKDLKRLDEINVRGVEKYFVLFQNLPHCKIAEEYSSAIKYLDEMNKYAKENTSIEEIKRKYQNWWKKKILNDLDEPKKEQVETFSLRCGKYFDVEIDIEGFIYGPI